MSDFRSSKLIDWWLEGLFVCYGNPDQLVSDNGPQFISAQLATFLSMHGIEHIHTAIYNPSENRLVEVLTVCLNTACNVFKILPPTCSTMARSPARAGRVAFKNC